MNDAPSYFDNVYEDEWIEDPFVKEMIQDVDSSTVISAHIIESPILGPITPKELSGGVKVLILIRIQFDQLRQQLRQMGVEDCRAERPHRISPVHDPLRGGIRDSDYEYRENRP